MGGSPHTSQRRELSVYREFLAIAFKDNMTRIAKETKLAQYFEVSIADDLISPVDRENMPNSAV